MVNFQIGQGINIQDCFSNTYFITQQVKGEWIVIVKIKKDLTGQRFGRLVVIKQVDDYVNPSGTHYAQWLCKCDCGNEAIVAWRYQYEREHTKRM